MIWSLAWRNIWRNRTRSIIIMTSVTIGLFAGVFVMALYQGIIKARVRTVIDTEVGHLQIHHQKFKDDYNPKYLLDQERIMAQLEELSLIRYLSPKSQVLGMVSTTTGSAEVRINGIISSYENETSQLNKKIKEGNVLTASLKNGVLIGRKLADKMKLKLSNKLVLTFSDKESDLTAGAFRVVGIFQSDNAPFDELNVYVHKEVLNNYLKIGPSCHEVVVILKHDEDLAKAKQQIQTMFPNLLVETWKETSPETNLMVGYVDEFAIVYVIIIMFALAFGIINTMLMSVLERTREIGMLSALGMNPRRVFSLILSETVLLTLIGAPIGTVLSWAITNHYHDAGIDISAFSGAVMSDFGFSSMIYPEFPLNDLPNVLLIVVGTALISAVFPSLKAIKLQPADALRQ